MMKNKAKRWWTLLVAVCLCFALGATAFADEKETESIISQKSGFEQNMLEVPAQHSAEIQSTPGTLFPLSNYPVGSYFSQTGVACTCHHNNCSYYGNCDCQPYAYAIQCMGFAKYAYDQFSHRSSWTDISADRDNTVRDISTTTKAQQYMGALPIGTYV